jgi:FAD/FMN-containing dehydrogenase
MNDLAKKYEAFGRYPKYSPKGVINWQWRNKFPINPDDSNILPRGYGRSYGDSCLNKDGILLDTTELNHIIEFNEKTGILRAEAGIQFKDIIKFSLPKGWFLPVTPGTKMVSLAGAIANDIHGKNHHSAGTFGRFVKKFELAKSSGERLICSKDQNSEIFAATIGGLGLTGTISWAEIQMEAMPSAYLYAESLKYKNLDEFFEINEDSESKFPFTVAWVDCTSSGRSLGRGLYNRGRNADPQKEQVPNKFPENGMKPFPLDYPIINELTVKTFNKAFYNKQLVRHKKGIVHFDPFYYPLDGFDGWNKAYGKNGFLQYQFVIPFENGKETIRKIIQDIQRSKLSSFLVVLKTFGELESPGMLSFPFPGYTLALDFRMDGIKTLKLLDELDKYVVESKGRLYPAKDARMKPEHFKLFYPKWRIFSNYVDPKHSSSFWRRVMSEN